MILFQSVGKKEGIFLPVSSCLLKNIYMTQHTNWDFKVFVNEQNRYFTCKMLFLFSMICSGGSFRMIPRGNNTKPEARLNFRCYTLLNLLFGNRIEDLRIHMKEEGTAIKEIIEKSL